MVILYEDIFGSQPLTAAIEDMPTLPKAHLDAIEERYRLVRWLPGSLMAGNFLYQPMERHGPSPEACDFCVPCQRGNR